MQKPAGKARQAQAAEESTILTPTRVLRSGKRIQATPTPNTRKVGAPARVALEPEERVLQQLARRTPIPEVDHLLCGKCVRLMADRTGLSAPAGVGVHGQP